eukprot:3374845-Amphidinium_carterae.1
MAFPSASRTWTKRVFRQMSIPTGLERLLNVLLEETESLIQWEGQLHWAFYLTSGLLQGSPLAALQFVVALMPWLVFMQTRLSPGALFSAYMDDCWFASSSCREFAILFKGTELLRLVAGLGVNMAKTFVLVLGDITEEAWRDALFVAMGRQGCLSEVINITTSAKHLGHMLGAGSDWDAVAAAKMIERMNILKDMRIGLARHLQLLGVVATSVTTHSLGAFVPSVSMSESWTTMASQFSAGPRGWARDLLGHGKEILGLPCDLPTLEETSLSARLSCLMRSVFWLPALEQRVRTAQRMQLDLDQRPCSSGSTEACFRVGGWP